MKKELLERQADQIDQFIKEGKITESDFPELILQGLNQEAIDCWYARKPKKSLFKKICEFIVK